MSNATRNVKTLARGTSGTDPGLGGMWPDVTAATTILRLRDRLMVGGGAAFTANFTGTQSGFVPTSTEGANWAPRDSTIFAASDKGLMQVTGFVSNANIDTTGGQPTESIGVAGFAIGNKASRSVWGLYSDVQFSNGNYGYGVEIAAKNLTTDRTSTPYFATTGVYGVWLAGGGDTTYGGSAANPSNCAIAIGRTSGSPHGWNRGIVIFADGITGTDGTTGTGTAIEMAKGHIISWRAPGNFGAFSIRSDISTSASDVSLVATNSALSVLGNSGAALVQFSHQSGSVNYWQMQNAATGAHPQIIVAGTDTNIDLRLTPQGTGNVRFGTHTVNADAPVVGYITIKDAGGTTRKLACIA